MEERIPRTAGNVYERADKDTWMVFPRYEDKKFTSFVDIGELTISEDGLDPDVDKVSVREVLEDIENLQL